MDADVLSKYFERQISRTEFYEWIGIQLVTVEEGRIVGKVPFDERLSPPSPPGPESLHGGVISTLVDMSAIGAALSTVPKPQNAFISTSQLQIDFVESVQVAVRAEGVVNRLEDQRAEVSVEVVRAEHPDKGPVATGEVTCLISSSD